MRNRDSGLAPFKRFWAEAFPKPNHHHHTSSIQDIHKSPSTTVATTPSLWSLLTCLTPIQWALFLSGYFCWVADAYDFYCVSLTIKDLAAKYAISPHDVTVAITMSLLFRPLGAAIFGIASDRYGRRWPLVINMAVIALFAFMTPVMPDYSSFLVARSLFGLGMGGVWGLAAATSMENMPVQAKGLFSGLFQPGFGMGVILCVCVNMIVTRYHLGWQTLFYTGGGFSLFLAVTRAMLPESKVFLEKKQRESNKMEEESAQAGPSFGMMVLEMFRKDFGTFLWATALTTGLSGLSNGSQGIFPLFLEETKEQPKNIVSLVIIVGNAGGMIGPWLSGYYSQIYGRKLLLLLCTLCTLLAVPLCIYPNDGIWLLTGYFFIQFSFQGGWGITPVYLNELAPKGFKAFFPGLVYQLGVMIASPYTFLEAAYGDAHHLENDKPDYGTGMAIVLLGSCLLICSLLLFSKERKDLGNNGDAGDHEEQVELGNIDSKTLKSNS